MGTPSISAIQDKDLDQEYQDFAEFMMQRNRSMLPQVLKSNSQVSDDAFFTQHNNQSQLDQQSSNMKSLYFH